MVTRRQLTYFRFVHWPSEVLIGDLIIIAELACSLITLKGKLSCPGNEGVWVEEVCSSTRSSSTLCGVEWPLYTPGEGIFEAGCAPETVRTFWRTKDSPVLASILPPVSCSTQLFHFSMSDPSPTSYPPYSASSRSCNVCPAPAPSHFLLHSLLTCKLTTTPAVPYNDREASCTYYWSIHRQFSPSASPFMSYRLDPLTSVSISVDCLSVFLRKP